MTEEEQCDMDDEDFGTIDQETYCPACGVITFYTDDGQECHECGWSDYKEDYE